MQDYPEYFLPLVYGIVGLVGLISCFFGYRLFKLVIILVMAIAGAVLLGGLAFTYGDSSIIWTVGGFTLGAVLGGILALSFYSLAVATLAALFVATSLLPWVQDFELWTQWTILGIACLIAALIATAISKIMIQLASAMLGALLLVHSFLFFRSGQSIHRLVEGTDDWVLHLNLDGGMALIALGVGLLGFLFQRWSTR